MQNSDIQSLDGNKLSTTTKYFGRSVNFDGYSSLLAWAKANPFAYSIFINKAFDDLPISYGSVWTTGNGMYSTGIKVFCVGNNSNSIYVRTISGIDATGWATEWEVK